MRGYVGEMKNEGGGKGGGGIRGKGLGMRGVGVWGGVCWKREETKSGRGGVRK